MTNAPLRRVKSGWFFSFRQNHFATTFFVPFVLLLAMASACGGGGGAKSTSSPPVISSFTAANSSITSGGSTTLSWTVSNAASLTINGIAVSGTSYTVSPTITTIYTLAATNSTGSVTAQLTVTVADAPEISSFTAANGIIASGSSTTLNWTVSNATTLSINGTTVTGTSLTVSPTTTTTYTLTATNAVGNGVTASTDVVVEYAPSVTSFSATPSQIVSGHGTTLNWSVDNNTTLTINGNSVGGTFEVVSPASTTTYTLAAANDVGQNATAQVTVTVLPGIFNFTTSQPNVGVDGLGATLNWTVDAATSLSLASTPAGGGTTTTNVSGTTSLTVHPTTKTVYVLTATNISGSTTSLPVTVTATTSLDDISSFLASPTASTSSGTSINVTAIFATGDTAAIKDDHGNTIASSVSSGVPVPVSPSTTTTYTLTVTNPSLPLASPETRTLRVIVGDITDFSGVGNLFVFGDTTFSDGSAAAAEFEWPGALTTDSTGYVYFVDQMACLIEELDPSGNATRVAGMANNCNNGTPVDGNALTTATFGPYMRGVAAESSGNVYVGDEYDCEIRKISGGVVSTPAGNNNRITDVDGPGSTAGFACGLTGYSITDLALDSKGELIVAEGRTIRVMDSSGTVTTLAGDPISPNLTDGTGKTGSGANTALFEFVKGIAIDTSTDTIYLVDDNTIRTMTPNKSTGTGAATWTWTIRTWANPSDTAGHADGAAVTAQLDSPAGIARATDGTLFVTDGGYTGNSYIRRITPSGVVDSIAGNGSTCNPGTMCTLPNSSNPAPDLLPGVVFSNTIVVDPTSNRFFFNVGDVTSVYTMPF